MFYRLTGDVGEAAIFVARPPTAAVNPSPSLAPLSSSSSPPPPPPVVVVRSPPPPPPPPPPTSAGLKEGVLKAALLIHDAVREQIVVAVEAVAVAAAAAAAAAGIGFE